MFAFAPNAKLLLRLVRAISISGYSMTSSIMASGASFEETHLLTLIWALADLVPGHIPWNLTKIKERVIKHNKRIGDSFVCNKTWQSNLSSSSIDTLL